MSYMYDSAPGANAPIDSHVFQNPARRVLCRQITVDASSLNVPLFILEVNIRNFEGGRFLSLLCFSYLLVELQLLQNIITRQHTTRTAIRDRCKTIIYN